jgi:UDP-N-acetylglucosamine--dolichyl-phosphate N-acetylglucosaminephosphotransferase
MNSGLRAIGLFILPSIVWTLACVALGAGWFLAAIGPIFFLAFATTEYTTPRIISRMEKNGFVAPDMNKKGSPSVAEMGGTAIFFGFFAAAVLAIFLHSFFGWIPLDLTLLFAGFMTILLIAFIGIFDDIIGWKKGIRQYQHALFPIFAALPLMAVKAGTTVISVPLFGPVDFGLAYALVLIPFAVTGAANATNMLAGLNGLEAGLGAIMAGTMLLLSVVTKQPEAAVICAALLGALLGFLRFNWFPARIFPGDATTLMIGAAMAVAAILGNMEKIGLFLFALFFVDFWFQLARWLDSTILDALYGWGFGANRPHTNFDPLIGLNNAFGDMLLNFVMATMFIVLPGFWVTALAWAGVRAGNVLQGLSEGTKSAGQAGSKGTGMLSADKNISYAESAFFN